VTTELQQALTAGAGASTALASALPWPEAQFAFRVIAAGLGVASLMLREGATPEQTVAAIKRVRHLDTSADDASVDAKVDAKS